MTDLEPFITPATRTALIEHMKGEAPKECCGLIELHDGEYRYVPLENVADDPENAFKLSRADTVHANTCDNVIAICHSHPKAPVHPSKRDMEMQIAVNKPFVVGGMDPDSGRVGVYSFGDHLLDYPLVNRPWLYAVFDCLEALRAWYWQRMGTYLYRVPRTDFWWDKTRQDEVAPEDKDIYVRSIEPYGFERYEPVLEDPSHRFHPKIGDVLLMQYDSPYANHAAVIDGNDLVYHHRYGRKSGHNPLGYFLDQKVIRHWCRHRSMM